MEVQKTRAGYAAVQKPHSKHTIKHVKCATSTNCNPRLFNMQCLQQFACNACKTLLGTAEAAANSRSAAATRRATLAALSTGVIQQTGAAKLHCLPTLC